MFPRYILFIFNWRKFGLSVLVCITLSSSLTNASAQTSTCGNRQAINSLDEMWSALYACWQPPADSNGMAITLRFSLRRDGTLIGKPVATYSKLSGNDFKKRVFVASVIEALDKVVPLPLTDSMGGAIAGRPLALLFTSVSES
jgi:hypothetical protein